ASRSRRRRRLCRGIVGADQGGGRASLTRMRPARGIAVTLSCMKLESVELRRISMPLVSPFRTSFGTEVTKDALLVRVHTPDAEGWGECVAMGEPLYSAEYVDSAQDVLRRFLL